MLIGITAVFIVITPLSPVACQIVPEILTLSSFYSHISRDHRLLISNNKQSEMLVFEAIVRFLILNLHANQII